MRSIVERISHEPVIDVQTAAALRANSVSAASRLKLLRSPVMLGGQNWISALRLRTSVQCQELNLSAVLTGKPTLMKRSAKLHLLPLIVGGNPPLLISDSRISLWYRCCRYINLNPSRFERSVGGFLKEKLSRSERESGTSVVRSISLFFIYLFFTNTDQFTKNSNWAQFTALSRLCVRHTSSRSCQLSTSERHQS